MHNPDRTDSRTGVHCTALLAQRRRAHRPTPEEDGRSEASPIVVLDCLPNDSALSRGGQAASVTMSPVC
jgi:hypothetical protein